MSGSELKKNFITAGIIVFVFGLIFLIWGISDFSDSKQQSEEATTQEELRDSGDTGFTAIFLIGLGGFIMVIGIAIAVVPHYPLIMAWMFKPTAKEIGKSISTGDGERVTEVIKVRCPSCQALNPEENGFCGSCGGDLITEMTAVEGSPEPTEIDEPEEYTMLSVDTEEDEPEPGEEALSIEEVLGELELEGKYAEFLKDAGVLTAGDLMEKSIADLIKIEGINPTVARKLLSYNDEKQ